MFLVTVIDGPLRTQSAVNNNICHREVVVSEVGREPQSEKALKSEKTYNDPRGQGRA